MTVGFIALCSFVDGGTVWRLAERVVQPYLPSEGRQEEYASKIKLLKLFLQPGLLRLLTEFLFTVPCLFLSPLPPILLLTISLFLCLSL